MDTKNAHRLLNELLNDPVKFSEQGKPYELLQEYFEGFDLDTLRPLLRSSDEYIQSAAAFIVSELGNDGSFLIDDVIPLMEAGDFRVRDDAVETITRFSTETNFGKFMFVVRAMDDLNDMVRVRAMEMTSVADVDQISKSIELFCEQNDYDSNIHFRFLPLLLRSEAVEGNEIIKMLKSEERLIRRYGVILAGKKFQHFPALLENVTFHSDPDIQEYAKAFKERFNK